METDPLILFGKEMHFDIYSAEPINKLKREGEPNQNYAEKSSFG